MKFLILSLGVLLFEARTYASTGAQMWNHLDDQGKEELLDAHLEFFEEYSATTQEELGPLTTSTTLFELISSAYAAGDMNCIYAGWPSKRVNGLCSSPVRHNPGYETGKCKSSELQCQPMLFGSGLCVPTATQQQRNLAFSNCTQKFANSGRSASDVVREIEKSNKQTELFEMMNFAQSTCTSGKQASTPMCKKLLQVVSNLKSKVDFSNKPKKVKENKKEEKEQTPPQAKDEEKELTPPTPPRENTPVPPKNKPEVIINGKTESDPKVEEDFIRTIEQANKLNTQANNTGVIMCDTNVPYQRVDPRPFKGIGQNSKGPIDEYYVIADNADKTQYTSGVRITNEGPNDIAPGKTSRIWDFLSIDQSLNGTFIEVTDDPNPGFTTQILRSVFVLIPRKEVPRAEVKGDEVHVTLPTGEMVIFDAKTKKIKKGAMTEKEIDTSNNRFKRKFNTDYAGEGISIRSDSRGGDARTGAGNVVITQKGKKCVLPKEQVWGGPEHRPVFKFNDDKKLVDFINQSCTSKFSL